MNFIPVETAVQVILHSHIDLRGRGSVLSGAMLIMFQCVKSIAGGFTHAAVIAWSLLVEKLTTSVGVSPTTNGVTSRDTESGWVSRICSGHLRNTQQTIPTFLIFYSAVECGRGAERTRIYTFVSFINCIGKTKASTLRLTQQWWDINELV